MSSPSAVITDKRILEWIVAKELTLSQDKQRVIFAGKILSKTKVGTEGKNGVRYRYQLCRFRVKRTVLAGKLHWMIANKQIVPKGYEIHHKDGDRYNDHPNNLECLTEEDHRLLHNPYQPEEDSSTWT